MIAAVRLIYVHFTDGRRDLAHVVPATFDVEAWAASRQDAARLLGVTRVTYEDMQVEIPA